MTWYRGSEPLPKKSTRFRYLEDAGVHSLVVSEASRSEAGLYTCRASNAHGHRDTSVSVEVVGNAARGKPAMFINRPDTNLSLAVGEDITLSFRVCGDPKPKGQSKVSIPWEQISLYSKFGQTFFAPKAQQGCSIQLIKSLFIFCTL